MLTRLISDVDATQDLFIRGIAPPLTAALVGAGATTAVLLILAPAAGVLAAGLLAAGVLVPLAAAASARRAARRAAPARGELGAAVTDLLNGAAELHAFGAVEAGLDRARAADAELTRLARRSASASGLGTGLTAAVSGLTLWGVLLLGVAATGSGNLGRVPLAVITLTALAAFEAVTALPAAALQLGQARAAADRIADVLDTPDPVRVPDHPFPPPARPVTISHPRGHGPLSGASHHRPFGILILTCGPDAGSPWSARPARGSPRSPRSCSASSTSARAPPC